ncbi:hypothetical protein [Paenibacillus swuensis]
MDNPSVAVRLFSRIDESISTLSKFEEYFMAR